MSDPDRPIDPPDPSRDAAGFRSSGSTQESDALDPPDLSQDAAEASAGATAASADATGTPGERVVQVARDLVAERIGVVEGARALTSLQWEAAGDQFDPDFKVFALIDMKSDLLPMGVDRESWTPETLAAIDEEIRAIGDAHREEAVAACRVLIERFGG